MQTKIKIKNTIKKSAVKYSMIFNSIKVIDVNGDMKRLVAIGFDTEWNIIGYFNEILLV